MPKKNRLVMIEWIDAHGASNAKWRDLEDIKDTCHPLYITSVGFLIASNNGMKTIVPHIYSEKQDKNIYRQGQGEMVIPIPGIKRITPLNTGGTVPKHAYPKKGSKKSKTKK